MDKQLMLPFGLGSVCDAECRQKAQRRPRVVSAQSTRTAIRGHASPAKRRYITERDGGCRYCGTTKNTHVHHILYRSEGGTSDERNLICLCGAHHDLCHSNKRRYQPALKELIRLHYDDDRFLTVLEVLNLSQE